MHRHLLSRISDSTRGQSLRKLWPNLLRMRLFLFLLSVVLIHPVRLPAQTMLVAPYLQPGDGSKLGASDVKVIEWWTDQKPGDFIVEYAVGDAPPRTFVPQRLALDFGLPKPKPLLPPLATPSIFSAPAPLPSATPAPIPSTNLDDLKQVTVRESAVVTPEVVQHLFRYSAILPSLPFDSTVHYRVRRGGAVVAEHDFKTRASATKAIRFVAVGDLANGKTEQNAVAWQMAQQQPDFMIALGDITYPQGRVGQYLHHFWPTFNSTAEPGPKTGAPLLASVPLYPVVGNHDVEVAKLPDYPNAWGAFYFFQVPTNGPGVGPWNLPLGRDRAAAANFRAKVGATYPSLNVYSWDDGPAHFVAFDTSSYVRPDDPTLRTWLAADLRNSKQPWKFICVHAPGFHTSREHYTEQKLRLWEPLFEQGGVDMVLAGHVHNYQRSKPLHFTPVGGRDTRGRVNGDLRLDENFDGVKNTVADGIIHIVSGGGGATLYSVDFARTVEALQKEHGANFTPLTAKYVPQHGFSVLDLTPTTLQFRQIALTGEEIDRFTMTKRK